MKRKKKKENINLCMKYHCKECPRSRKCEEEYKREEQRRYEQFCTNNTNNMCNNNVLQHSK